MKVLIKVKAEVLNKDWTISKVYDALDGNMFCRSIEDEVRKVKVHGETAVWAGIYPLGHRHSPKFSASFLWNEKLGKLVDTKKIGPDFDKTGYVPHELIWIMNIEQFDFCLAHWGNSDDDTDGCLCVGGDIYLDADGQQKIGNSRATYIKFYEHFFPLVKQGGYSIEYIRKAA